MRAVAVGRFAIIVLVLSALLSVSTSTEAAEQSFRFSGTLLGNPVCSPPSDQFCGPYAGTLRIDDSQSGASKWRFSYMYTAEMEIKFADGNTASCKPAPLPLVDPTFIDEDSEALSLEELELPMSYCRIHVEKVKAGNLFSYSFDIQFNPIGSNIIWVALKYKFENQSFELDRISQVLEILSKFREEGNFIVTGGACTWGPCWDHTVTRLNRE